jgi:hypothetical protein
MNKINSRIGIFGAEHILPQNMILKSAGSHFYRIGLSLFPFGSEKRKKLFNPYFITIIISFSLLKSMLSLLIPEDDNYYKYHILFGDWVYFMKARLHITITQIIYGLIALISQLLNYWYYKNNISPSYLKSFEMMSGLVSPQSIGLSNREDIEKLLNRSRFLFFICGILTKASPFVGISASFVPFLNSVEFYYYLAFIPWVLLFALFIYFSSNFIVYQILYFYLICYYLKIKLINENSRIKNLTRSRSRINNSKIKQILNSLNSIHSEIDEFNANHWNKFLFWILILIIMTMDFTIFTVLFGRINIFLKLVGLYSVLIFMSLLVFLLNIASSISYEANNSYKLLIKLFALNGKLNINKTDKIKVYLIIFYAQKKFLKPNSEKNFL